MYYLLSLIQLIIFLTFMINSFKKQGLTSIVDQGKIMFILWIMSLTLYDLRLSSLYNPTITINIIGISIWGSFFILSRYIFLKKEDITYTLENVKKYGVNEIYSVAANVIFVLGLSLFAYNVNKYGLTILEENRVNKQPLDHYSSYVIYMLVLASEIKYILFRNYRKILDLIIFMISIFALFLTLNRGPIAFLFVTIALYEVFNFINISKRLSKTQRYITYGSLSLLIIGFVIFFGFVGNLRMEYVLEEVYQTTLWEHYGVSTLMPSALLWVYVYITSPFENIAFSLVNETVSYAYFNNLLYPFIKFSANLIGKGEEYKAWLIGRGSYTPYLQEKVGLNAATFIPEAYQDFGFIGFIVYLGIYILIAYSTIKIMKTKVGYSSLGKILIYTNGTSMLIWTVFTNSFKIPILIMNIMLVLFIEYAYKKGYFKFWFEIKKI
ncbi:hypothetical protein J2Z44_000959 [Clostridium punense]|uniref:Oligosaccharide repeat unit polymerase n=1 Tax=Clostridium punense TaxID=1054297 RepID=A0ABS4K058_9CLOT|nr:MULTISPECIES: O-antigen polymerase [Clostridium]EQB88384.1 hypothetical protein M918_04380 [Clostridium sp. BL8]MBP2021172.1 hypothetical protein [Clostridium punense]